MTYFRGKSPNFSSFIRFDWSLCKCSYYLGNHWKCSYGSLPIHSDLFIIWKQGPIQNSEIMAAKRNSLLFESQGHAHGNWRNVGPKFVQVARTWSALMLRPDVHTKFNRLRLEMNLYGSWVITWVLQSWWTCEDLWPHYYTILHYTILSLKDYWLVWG